ncbi:MAG: hypothetical protein WAV78_14795 [Xanthobacteraceae bacterium]
MRNPEAGFTLYGTASKGSKRSGGHIDGLVAVLGYPLAPGRAHDARRNVVRRVLDDLKAVAVDKPFRAGRADASTCSARCRTRLCRHRRKGGPQT